MRLVYYVTGDNCTPDEPSPGWYVGSETSADVENDGPTGPYIARVDALEARYEMMAEAA